MKSLLKNLGPWTFGIIFLLGVLGVFITWWVLLITWDTADNIGQLWYYWFRSIYLGIPVLVLINIIIWKEKKGKFLWLFSFIGAPIFVTLLRAISWLVSALSDLWSRLFN